MAKVTMQMPDDFAAKITSLGNMTDTVIERALKAGGETALGIFKGSLAGAIGRSTKYDSKSTGELLSSLGVTPVKIDNEGNPNVKVGFNEPRRNQGSGKGKKSYKTKTNAMIANVLEYGRHNQPPRPFSKPAKAAATKQCTEIVKAELERAFNEL